MKKCFLQPGVNWVVVLLLMFTLGSCSSVQKYNKKLEQKIPIAKLIKDINFVQRNLYKKHPDFDYYTSKVQLDKSFDSLRASIHKPLSSREFYFLISSVVAQVHQAHISMIPVFEKNTKKRRKFLKEMGVSPLRFFEYENVEGEILVNKNFSEDTAIKIGDQLLAINGISVEKIYEKYIVTLSSDGYNQTGLNFFFAKRIPSFYRAEIGNVDMATFTFKNEGGEYDKILIRKPKKEKRTAVNDTIKNSKIEPVDSIKKDKELIASEKEKVKVKEQSEAKKKIIMGYDASSKEYIRDLTFLKSDSSLAYFKIKSFSKGLYKKAYEEVFETLNNAPCNTLVLDLRDNVGGRAAEIVDLFAYFVDTNFKMYLPSKVSSRTTLLSPGLYRNTSKILWPVISLYYPAYVFSKYFWTYKDKNGSYYYTGLKGTRFSKTKDYYFSGKIYLLVNGGTFSAASLLASRMSSLANVEVVGEETGGDYNGTVAGILPVLTLPNSKIKWRLGLMHIKTINQRPLKGRGVMPDKPLQPTVSDVILKKDAVLDWVMQQL